MKKYNQKTLDQIKEKKIFHTLDENLNCRIDACFYFQESTDSHSKIVYEVYKGTNLRMQCFDISSAFFFYWDLVNEAIKIQFTRE